MTKPRIEYLKLLNLESDFDVLNEFRDYVSNESNLTIKSTEKSPEAKSILLSEDDYLVLSQDLSDSEQEFFQWWVEHFRNRLSDNRDELTGLYTRSYWETNLKPDLRKSSELSVVLIDIDHFKRFNDHYGHQMGDRVLEAVGQAIRDLFPDDDWLIRYGGEEILVCSEKIESFHQKLTEFRKFLGSTNLFENQPEKVTVSIGFSNYDSDSDSLEASIDEADVALYQSKADGRDQVTEYYPYLRRKEEYSIWGFYRYLDENPLRFALGRSNDFILFWRDKYQYYNWNENQAQLLQGDQLDGPPKSIKSFGDRFYVIDQSGQLWVWDSRQEFQQLTSQDDPMVTGFVGGIDCLLVHCLNNQIYKPAEDGLDRVNSAPEYWEHTATTDKIYFVLEGSLVEWTDEERGCEWELPADCSQIEGSAESVYLLSNSGKIYCFDETAQHWRKLKIRTKSNQRLLFSRMDTRSDQLLATDRRGQLLLTGARQKSVPQTMKLIQPPRS